MKCEETRPLLCERIEGELDGGEAAALDRHLAECSGCRDEAAELANVWNLLGELEQDEAPGPEMSRRFYAMLAGQRQDARRSTGAAAGEWLRGWWPRRPAFQIAVAAAALLAGFWLGPRLQQDPGTGRVERLQSSVEALTRDMTLLLFEHRSASERLRAVGLSAAVPENVEISRTLLEVIGSDSSVNVRLAALDVLSSLVERPAIRSGLLAALPRQQSPTMQVALADLLIEMNGPGSRQALTELLERPDLDPQVRDHVTGTLSRQGADI